MQSLVLCMIFFQLALAQLPFNAGGGSCNYDKLYQASMRKETCMKDFETMAQDLMREIQRADRQCFQGVDEALNQCKQPTDQFKRQNDLDTQGIFECCFPGRTPGSPRRCEFRNKADAMKSNGSRKKRGASYGGPSEMHEEMERKMMSSMTMGGLCMWGMAESVEMVEGLTMCLGQGRMINDQAMNVYRQYKDRMIAKLFECESLVIQESTNCTETSPNDLDCVITGIWWADEYLHDCISSCMPGSLEAYCKIFTQQ